MPETTETPAELPMNAAALIRQVAPDTLAAEVDDEAQSQRSEDQDRLQNPSTSESVIAGYLVGWRQRVERIGTANFPQRFITGSRDYGRPVLEVAIRADGTLADIIVRRSSGDSSLDQAALKILRMAAPFESLPEPILAEHDVLRFAYEWDFSSGKTASDTAPANN